MFCEICGETLVELESCESCKGLFCTDCGNRGICLVCEEARCYICGEYLAARACNECGKLVCEDHGIKIGEATLCERCQES